MARDEFSARTKTISAKRVGYSEKHNMLQSYRLKIINDTLIGLAAIFLLFPFLCGVFICGGLLRKYINDGFLSDLFDMSIWLSLILFSLLFVWLYKKYASISIVSVNKDHLLVVNDRNKKRKQYPFGELAFIDIQYMSEKGLMIHIISNKGKCILSCLYNEQFRNSLIKQIQTTEKLIYAKKGRNLSTRCFYINPIFLDSAIVKTKIKRAAYYYPLFIIILTFVVLFIIGGVYLYLFEK